jgi:hypothetical protein
MESRLELGRDKGVRPDGNRGDVEDRADLNYEPPRSAASGQLRRPRDGAGHEHLHQGKRQMNSELGLLL